MFLSINRSGWFQILHLIMLAALASNKTNIVIYQIIKQPLYFVLLFLRFVFINRRGWFKNALFRKVLDFNLILTLFLHTLLHSSNMCNEVCSFSDPFSRISRGFPIFTKNVVKIYFVSTLVSVRLFIAFLFPDFSVRQKKISSRK